MSLGVRPETSPPAVAIPLSNFALGKYQFSWIDFRFSLVGYLYQITAGQIQQAGLPTVQLLVLPSSLSTPLFFRYLILLTRVRSFSDAVFEFEIMLRS